MSERRRLLPARPVSVDERCTSLPAAAAAAPPPPPPASSGVLEPVRTRRPGHQAWKGEGGEVPAVGGDVPSDPAGGAAASAPACCCCCSGPAGAAAGPSPLPRLSSGSGGLPLAASRLPIVMGWVVAALLPEEAGAPLSAASAASLASAAGRPAEVGRRPGGGELPGGTAEASGPVLRREAAAAVGDAPAGTACCPGCCCRAARLPLLPPVPASRVTSVWCSWEGVTWERQPGVGVADRELRRLAVGEPPSGEPPTGLPPRGDKPAGGQRQRRLVD